MEGCWTEQILKHGHPASWTSLAQSHLFAEMNWPERNSRLFYRESGREREKRRQQKVKSGGKKAADNCLFGVQEGTSPLGRGSWLRRLQSPPALPGCDSLLCQFCRLR